MERFWGSWVKEFREEHGMTQSELAIKMKISRNTLCKIEQNTRKLTLENYLKICELAGVQPKTKNIWKENEKLKKKIAKVQEELDIIKPNLREEMYRNVLLKKRELEEECKNLKKELEEKKNEIVKLGTEMENCKKQLKLSREKGNASFEECRKLKSLLRENNISFKV